MTARAGAAAVHSTTLRSTAVRIGAAVALAGALLATAPAGRAQPTPSAPPAGCVTRQQLAAWPLEKQVGQIVMVGIPITQAAKARTLVRRHGLGGILVRGTPGAGTKATIAGIRAAGGDIPPIIAVDEEGGRVQHLRRVIGPIPSAREMARTMSTDAVRVLARKHGTAMRNLGFTMVLGPVLDLSAGNEKWLGDRSFSPDPQVTAAFGLAFTQGMLEAGLTAVTKHFPGHGRSNGDSHRLGAVVPPIDELRAVDLVPFAHVVSGAPTAGVMTAHVVIPGLQKIPASLSPAAVLGVLRGELRHQGIVVTDSLSMWSVRYNFSASRAAELALRAGNDLLLFDDEPGVATIIAGVADAVRADPALAPRLVEALVRVLAVKGVPECPAPAPVPSLPASSVAAVGQSQPLPL